MDKNKIKYIGIGAMKAGTTWLHDRLIETPGFASMPFKELHYFDGPKKYLAWSIFTNKYFLARFLHPTGFLNYNRILKAYRSFSKKSDKKWLLKYATAKADLNFYLSLFPENGIAGEITPSYSMLEVNDIKRMYEVAPNAKILFLIRNPIERVWSQFRFSLRGKKDFDRYTNIENIKKFINSSHLEKRGLYIDTIKNYSAVYPKNQIMIIFFDAIKFEPESLLKEVVTFIEPKLDYKPSLNPNKKSNESSIKIDMPLEIKEILIKKYEGDIIKIQKFFGSYSFNWLGENVDLIKKPTIILSNSTF